MLLDSSGVPHVADMGLARRLTPANAASLTGETGAPTVPGSALWHGGSLKQHARAGKGSSGLGAPLDYAEPVHSAARRPWSPELRVDGPLTCPWACAAPGTYFYMAPEMIRHEPYDQKADVYSWGVLLAEVLTQRAPYEGLYLTPVQARPPRPERDRRLPCCCPVRRAGCRSTRGNCKSAGPTCFTE